MTRILLYGLMLFCFVAGLAVGDIKRASLQITIQDCVRSNNANTHL